jgi:hypothetical protein
MPLPASSSASGWRTLSDAELAAEPDARLGGALAIIVSSAAAIAIIKGVLYLLTLMVVSSPHGLDMFDYVGMAPSVLFNVMLAAAFWGYMRESRRPNLFYRRRVRL